jgi:hypothetical protein
VTSEHLVKFDFQDGILPFPNILEPSMCESLFPYGYSYAFSLMPQLLPYHDVFVKKRLILHFAIYILSILNYYH